jgi:hypothetical protein
MDRSMNPLAPPSRRRASSVSLSLATALAAASVALLLEGCSAPGSDQTGMQAPLPDAGTSSGPASLPFAVSDEFQPTGFMGDTPADFNSIMMSNDSSQCPSPRVTGAVGVCYTVTWTPLITAGQSTAWVGVYWQYPANNWGAQEGRPIKSGASKVTFAAYGAKGGEQVEFLVGGINTTPGAADAGLDHADAFKATKLVTLTKGWATYEIPLTGDHYSQVIGGFAWSITAASATAITFYVDDIQWEP